MSTGAHQPGRHHAADAGRPTRHQRGLAGNREQLVQVAHRIPPHSARPGTRPRTRVDKASRSTVILATGKDLSSERPEAMADMNLGMTERLKPIHQRVAAMVRDEIAPLGEEFLAEIGKNGDRWAYTARQTEILEGLKKTARQRGLWNFWLTDSKRGYGLSTVEYAYLAEEMGKAHLGAETFNCSAP